MVPDVLLSMQHDLQVSVTDQSLVCEELNSYQDWSASVWTLRYPKAKGIAIFTAVKLHFLLTIAVQVCCEQSNNSPCLPSALQGTSEVDLNVAWLQQVQAAAECIFSSSLLAAACCWAVGTCSTWHCHNLHVHHLEKGK